MGTSTTTDPTFCQPILRLLIHLEEVSMAHSCLSSLPVLLLTHSFIWAVGTILDFCRKGHLLLL